MMLTRITHPSREAGREVHSRCSVADLGGGEPSLGVSIVRRHGAAHIAVTALPDSVQDVMQDEVLFLMHAQVGAGSHAAGTVGHDAEPSGPESGGGGGPPETM